MEVELPIACFVLINLFSFQVCADYDWRSLNLQYSLEIGICNYLLKITRQQGNAQPVFVKRGWFQKLAIDPKVVQCALHLHKFHVEDLGNQVNWCQFTF